MNKKLFILALGLLVLASCGKDIDLYQGNNEVNNEVNEKPDYLSHAEKMLGIKIDPNHDWCLTEQGQVNIKANASVRKVQLLVNVLIDDDDTQPAWVTRNSINLLNQAETKGRTDFTLYYDAPKDNLGLYVAFITDDGYYLEKVENGVATFSEGAKTRGEEQKLTTGYTLPSTDIKIAGSISSYASGRWSGWKNDGQLYYFDNYVHLKAAAPYTDYTQDFKDKFNAFIPGYLPNGRDYDNSGKVNNTDAYNNSVYITPKKDEPVILTPMYKCDHPADCGYEVYYSDLYYYYYNPSEVTGDFATYIKKLPKYKAIPFDQVFGYSEDMLLYKHDSFALLYFATQHGSTGPSVGDVGSFFFPEGYKIGFMVRAKTESEAPKKQGELYGDGRLNNEINKFGNFKSSGFTAENSKENFPRILWLDLNGKKVMTWESGTDKDFNDFFIEVEGGTVIPDDPDPEKEVYTYCFEDTQEGDYDLNDVVIKAVRIDETTVEYSIVACGAYDEIQVQGLDIPAIEGDEVHKLFGVTNPQTFINTKSKNYTNYPTGRKAVSSDFSFKMTTTHPYIKDLTTGAEVRMSKTGDAPHGIMIPGDFAYPTEQTRITDAYDKFGKWAENAAITSNRWYLTPNPGTTMK